MNKETKILEKLEFEKTLWKKGLKYIAGVDEAGRGPLAGPVVAAAVILKKAVPKNIPVRIDDSKKLSAEQRLLAYKWIIKKAVSYGVGIISHQEIDRINIKEASHLAMHKAIANLTIQPEHILVDGYPLLDPPTPQTAIIKGDSKSLSIAAASIIAKVVRDQVMQDYAEEYPHYDFHKNKGYGTAKHIDAIIENGLSPIHRRSFRPKQLQEIGFFNE